MLVYNLLLLIVGFVFGQFRFFWEFEKKFFSRFLFRKKQTSSERVKHMILKKEFIIILLFVISMTTMGKDMEKVTLGGGCFWCTEAVYLAIKRCKRCKTRL